MTRATIHGVRVSGSVEPYSPGSAQEQPSGGNCEDFTVDYIVSVPDLVAELEEQARDAWAEQVFALGTMSAGLSEWFAEKYEEEIRAAIERAHAEYEPDPDEDRDED